MSLRFDWYLNYQHELIISRSDLIIDRLITNGMARVRQSMAMNVVRSALGYCILGGLVFTLMKILLESGFDLLQNRGAMRGNFIWI